MSVNQRETFDFELIKQRTGDFDDDELPAVGASGK
jgi:hypothetical protein